MNILQWHNYTKRKKNDDEKQENYDVKLSKMTNALSMVLFITSVLYKYLANKCIFMKRQTNIWWLTVFISNSYAADIFCCLQFAA